MNFFNFDYRCVYDNSFIKMKNRKEILLTIAHGYLQFKSEFYGLNKKNKKAQKNTFKFVELMKLTIKN